MGFTFKYNRLIAAGLCTFCRKPLDGDSKLNCNECLRKMEERKQARWRRAHEKRKTRRRTKL